MAALSSSLRQRLVLRHWVEGHPQEVLHHFTPLAFMR